MNRRTVLKTGAAAAAVAILPTAGAAEPLPLLPPLEPLAPRLIDIYRRGLDRWGPIAEDMSMPISQRLLYQHVTARYHLQLAWPEADALRRFEAVAARWPLLRPNIARVARARIEERPDWDMAELWDYGRVRIDGGPPQSEV